MKLPDRTVRDVVRSVVRYGGVGSAVEPGGEPADPTAVTIRVERLARQDEDFAARLCEWAEIHRAALRVEDRQVHNTVTGGTAHGPVTRTGKTEDGITFGSPRAAPDLPRRPLTSGRRRSARRPAATTG